ncbi:GNAT family N-acetyltransferase [Brevundimonas sp.]|uniref:GNAT family N-acetyltransferase n=1 Tax=Brevundimonas sp. TaxID=1871086 RepID=UPI0035B43EE3
MTADWTQLRWAEPDDYTRLGEVMFDAVRNGDSPYSEAQRSAWVPQPRNGSNWFKRLDRQAIVVAERDSAILGFMSLAESGYIDFAYIRPEAQGTGLFKRLYKLVESQAINADEGRLWVHASLKAQPAFSAMGFRIVRPETVTIGDQILDRFEMEKALSSLV